MWKGRKSAFAAVGRISPAYFVQDGVIPRTRLPEVLAEISRLADKVGLRVANVFHAGDGNLHPLVLFDDAVDGQAHVAEELAGAILDLCVASGGSITGEHGVGHDKKLKMSTQFTPEDLDTMQLVRCAFDPDNLANPGKVFPTPRLCGERPGARTSADYHKAIIHLTLFVFVAGLICFFKAALRSAQEGLRRSEINFRSLVTHAPYGVCRCDSNGILLDVNPALVAMLGYDSKEDLKTANLITDIIRDPIERAVSQCEQERCERRAGQETFASAAGLSSSPNRARLMN